MAARLFSDDERNQEIRIDPQVLAGIAGEIAARLRRVCEHWPETEFQQMVQRLAEITIKYDRVAPTAVYDRRASDRIVVELKAALDRSERVRRDSGEVRGDKPVGIAKSTDRSPDDSPPKARPSDDSQPNA
jgi:hypothetical protein